MMTRYEYTSRKSRLGSKSTGKPVVAKTCKVFQPIGYTVHLGLLSDLTDDSGCDFTVLTVTFRPSL